MFLVYFDILWTERLIEKQHSVGDVIFSHVQSLNQSNGEGVDVTKLLRIWGLFFCHNPTFFPREHININSVLM